MFLTQVVTATSQILSCENVIFLDAHNLFITDFELTMSPSIHSCEKRKCYLSLISLAT